MDRRIRYALASIGLGLGFMLMGTGCRNLRAPEIPPEPSYYSPGAAGSPAVGFSSQPASVNPYGATATDNALGGMSYGADPAYAAPAEAAPAGNYAGSAYAPSVGTPSASPELPQPEPLQGLPADPAALPSGY